MRYTHRALRADEEPVVLCSECGHATAQRRCPHGKCNAALCLHTGCAIVHREGHQAEESEPESQAS